MAKPQAKTGGSTSHKVATAVATSAAVFVVRKLLAFGWKRTTGKTPPDPAAIARLSADARYNSMLHTTCVATRLSAGHANNALPQMAQANVNCRLLPGHSAEEIRQTLIGVFDDAKVKVRFVDNAGNVFDRAPDAKAFDPALPSAEILQPLTRVAAEMWPGVPVIPSMDSGASDSSLVRAAGIPSYGVPGYFYDIEDDRSHGRDERIRVTSFYEGVNFYYRFLKTLTSSR